jgi:hypothetical protein
MMRSIAWIIGLMLCGPGARAEVTEVRIAQQTSTAFLQFNVMKPQALIEKYAAALGLPKRPMVSGAVGNVAMTFGEPHALR